MSSSPVFHLVVHAGSAGAAVNVSLIQPPAAAALRWSNGFKWIIIGTMNQTAANPHKISQAHAIEGGDDRGIDRPDAAGSSLLFRLGCGVLALGCGVVLGLAVYVQPSPEGLGSHQQLSLPECGFYQRTGWPCPTCGMTTAFSLTVRGRVIQALMVQPAGTLGALASMLLCVGGGYLAVRGARAHPAVLGVVWWLGFHYVVVFLAVILTVAASWGWLCFLESIKTG